MAENLAYLPSVNDPGDAQKTQAIQMMHIITLMVWR
jgi:hypothetical protein